MVQLLRGLVALIGLFNIGLGIAFLTMPERMAGNFYILPAGIDGMAVIRADFTAFFLTGGVFALIGAWRMRAVPLAVPVMLLATAFVGRAVSAALDGVTAVTFQPMAAEAAMIGVLALAMAAFPRNASD